MWAKRGPECMSLSEPKPRRNPLLPVQCLTIRGPSYSRCPNAKRPVKSWGGNSGKIRGASNQAGRAQDCLRAGGSRGAAYTIPPSSPYKREQLNTAPEPGTHTGSLPFSSPRKSCVSGPAGRSYPGRVHGAMPRSSRTGGLGRYLETQAAS